MEVDNEAEVDESTGLITATDDDEIQQMYDGQTDPVSLHWCKFEFLNVMKISYSIQIS